MSFFKSIFNAVCDAGSELLDKQQDYAEGFEGMSDYQLKQLYREMRAHPYNVGILNGIARNSALEQECVARGIVISNQEAERQRQYWQVIMHSSENINPSSVNTEVMYPAQQEMTIPF